MSARHASIAQSSSHTLTPSQAKIDAVHRQLTDDLEAQQQSLLLSAERLEHSLSDDLRHGHTPERMHFSLSPACRGPGGAGAAAQGGACTAR